MPCPFFEPTREVIGPTDINGRLPLLDEYQGVCHGLGSPIAAPFALQFQCCNHGYSKGTCPNFPSDETRSSLNYSVLRQTNAALYLMCVEETAHTPTSWYELEYRFENGEVKPDPGTPCIHAQVAAFCRSYLRRFPPL